MFPQGNPFWSSRPVASAAEEMVRCTVAHSGNDHRLGAQEAPPAIISLRLGCGFSRGCGWESKRLRKPGCGFCQNLFGIPFWLAGEFTTHVRTYFSCWIG